MEKESPPEEITFLVLTENRRKAPDGHVLAEHHCRLCGGTVWKRLSPSNGGISCGCLRKRTCRLWAQVWEHYKDLPAARAAYAIAHKDMLANLIVSVELKEKIAKLNENAEMGQGCKAIDPMEEGLSRPCPENDIKKLDVDESNP